MSVFAGSLSAQRTLPRRTAYFSELLAFLAFRPHGATVAEVAEAFAAGRVREDVKILREWLGVNPRTGRRHLPDAREAAGARARGIPVYQVEDLLVDADLFRRLRVRGQARWAAETAVTAAPHEEIPRLDLVAVTAAEGRAAEARRILLEEVCNRSDDGQAPPDLPPRTSEIIDAAGWLAPTGTGGCGADA